MPCPARCADEVYAEVKKQAKDAVLVSIDKERDGEQIDRSLLKNVLGIFIEARMPCRRRCPAGLHGRVRAVLMGRQGV